MFVTLKTEKSVIELLIDTVSTGRKKHTDT